MEHKKAFSIIKEKLLLKVAIEDTSVQDQAPKVIQYGEGVPYFKPLTGMQTLGLSVAPPTPESVSKDIIRILSSFGYDQNSKFDPHNSELLANMVASQLQKEYKGYFDLVNPEYYKQ